MAVIPAFNHIVIVMMENHGYTQVIGSSNAPYCNSLVNQGALFTDSHGLGHPSFPNYLAFFSGSPQGAVFATGGDTCPPPGAPYSAPNLGQALIAGGQTFGAYAEFLPASKTACSNSVTPPTYAGRHVPSAWFSNVPSSTLQDFSAFPTTAAGYAALPTVSIVTPGLNHDMHSFGTLTDQQTIQAGDTWLQQNIDGYIQWAKTNNSLCIVQWDEDNFTTPDHIPTIFVGANVVRGSYSETINHYNILRTIEDAYGVARSGAAATATPITDCWAGGPPPPPPPSSSPVVQQTSGSTTGKTLTLTFPVLTTINNAVIIAVAGYAGGSISAITLGGVGSTFTRQATSGAVNAEIWANLRIQQASATVVITASTAGIIAWAYEVQSAQQAFAHGANGVGGPNAALDATAGNHGSGTSWSSGATGTTVSAQEFVVGLGLTVTSGTITGPGSGGWTNQTAVTNVAGASTIGAISGYQVPSATAAFTYSGTAGTSGSWGAVTATFLLMPQAGNNGSWSGYSWQPEQCPSGGYAGITTTFTVPSLTPPAPSPAGSGFTIWVGLGNAQPQTGIFCVYDTGHAGNNRIFNWTFFDGGSETWDATAYPTVAGDSLTLSITTDNTYFYLTQANATQGWSYTQQKSIQAVATVGTGLVLPKNLCEVWLESEGAQNSVTPDFGTIAFTNTTVTPTPVAAPIPWAYVQTGIVSVPGPFSSNSFTLTWNSQR